MEKKEFLNSFVERVDIYDQEQPDGRFLKHIKFRFPVYFGDRETQELCWDNESTVETVVLLSQHRDKSTCLDERGSRQIEMQASRLASLLAQKPDDTIESDLDLDELDTTRAELKARD